MAVLSDLKTIDNFIDSIKICKWTVTVQPTRQMWRQWSDFLDDTFGIDISHWKNIRFTDKAYSKEYADTHSTYKKELDRHSDLTPRLAHIDIANMGLTNSTPKTHKIPDRIHHI